MHVTHWWNTPPQGQSSLNCLFYVWHQMDLMGGGYGTDCSGRALVDVQCLWLMLGRVWVGDSQRTIVSPPPHCLLEWRQGTTGVCSPANYWGGCSQGCQRGHHTGLAPQCMPRPVVGGVVWTNGRLENIRWQMSASEWSAKITDGKWVRQNESS